MSERFTVRRLAQSRVVLAYIAMFPTDVMGEIVLTGIQRDTRAGLAMNQRDGECGCQIGMIIPAQLLKTVDSSQLAITFQSY